MSNDIDNAEPEFLSPEEVLAAAGFEWHPTSIKGRPTKQRAPEIDEFLLAYRECPEVAKLFEGDFLDKFASGGSLLETIDSVADDVLGVSRKAAAYLVAVSFGRGDDAEFRETLLKAPLSFLAAALGNVLDIAFSKGVDGFFTETLGPLATKLRVAGMTPQGIEKLIRGFVLVIESFVGAAVEAAEAEQPQAA